MSSFYSDDLKDRIDKVIYQYDSGSPDTLTRRWLVNEIVDIMAEVYRKAVIEGMNTQAEKRHLPAPEKRTK